MKLKRVIAAFSGALLIHGPPAFAHHSFAAYDVTQVRSLSGTVKNFQWGNPHVTFIVLVTSDSGTEPQEWNLVTSSPAILKGFDWTPESLKPGDRIRLECNPMSDGSHGGRLHSLVIIGSGRVLKTKLSPR